jgi:hypothetical protein
VCTGVWWENLRERDNWGDPGVDGKIILRRIIRKWNVISMEWIEQAQVTDRWRALANAGHFLTSCKAVGFSTRTLYHAVSKYSNFIA